MARKLVAISDITKFGDAIARSIRARLTWSKQLRGSVILHKAKENGGVVSITITVGEKKKDKSGNPLSGMARAYEYGSGRHATKGIAKKYTIKPRYKRALWFYMDNPYPHIPLYESGGKIGVVLPSVQHPGVKARPFISPALRDVLPRATEELRLNIAKNFREQLSLSIKKMGEK